MEITIKEPLVSVIIPTFNRKGPLCELVESLSRQTFQDFEVIIVNDQGESVDYVTELYPELKINITTPHQKLHHVGCRNEGLTHANGELIMLCDDDDFIVPDHLENMVKELADTDFVFTDVEMVEFKEKNNLRYATSRTLFSYEFDEELIRKFNTYVSSGSVYKKLIHELIGNFDEKLHNYWDWDFILRVMESGVKVKKRPVASAIYAFTSDSGQLSSQLNERRGSYLQKLSEKHQLGVLPQENFWTMMESPFVKRKRSESQVVWDGLPVKYRET
ncbi:glycosyltransferase family 2 protein [Bacillus carboniphilus]|uniref:Glycosyltransferase family 2 protein n=1 Tax=Bacillus carboniphilus TaxID=86663 RepID=A0ABN0VSG4_9BACI